VNRIYIRKLLFIHIINLHPNHITRAKASISYNTTLSELKIGTSDNDGWATGIKTNYYGSLDDIRVYNRALDSTEVNSIYHEGGYTTLPLNLINFTGSISDTSNILTWVTDSEINVASFLVEQSIDGIDYTNIGNVKAGNVKAGNVKAGKSTYSFIDANSSNLNTCYYRLKIVNNDGSITYSSVVSIHRFKGFDYQIKSNPVSSTLSINGNKMKTAKIFSSDGKMLITQSINSNNADINVSSLSKGVYILNIISNDGYSKTKRFIK